MDATYPSSRVADRTICTDPSSLPEPPKYETRKDHYFTYFGDFGRLEPQTPKTFQLAAHCDLLEELPELLGSQQQKAAIHIVLQHGDPVPECATF